MHFYILKMTDILQILIVGVVFFLMLGFGSTVRPADLMEIKKNPKPPITGFVSQARVMVWAPTPTNK